MSRVGETTQESIVVRHRVAESTVVFEVNGQPVDFAVLPEIKFAGNLPISPIRFGLVVEVHKEVSTTSAIRMKHFNSRCHAVAPQIVEELDVLRFGSGACKDQYNRNEGNVYVF